MRTLALIDKFPRLTPWAQVLAPLPGLEGHQASNLQPHRFLNRCSSENLRFALLVSWRIGSRQHANPLAERTAPPGGRLVEGRSHHHGPGGQYSGALSTDRATTLAGGFSDPGRIAVPWRRGPAHFEQLAGDSRADETWWLDYAAGRFLRARD